MSDPIKSLCILCHETAGRLSKLRGERFSRGCICGTAMSTEPELDRRVSDFIRKAVEEKLEREEKLMF